jgi:hypothetical protein
MTIKGGNFTGRVIDCKDKFQNYEVSLNIPFNGFVIMILSDTQGGTWVGEIKRSEIRVLKDGADVTHEFFASEVVPGHTDNLLAIMAKIAVKTNVLEGGELLVSNKG